MATVAKKRKAFSYICGEKGRNRVRAYEEEASRLFFVEWYERELGEPKSRRKRKSFPHKDRDRAKREADQIAAALAERKNHVTAELQLYELFDMYLRERTPEKGESAQSHDRRCAAMFLQFFSSSRTVATLNRRDWDRFVKERRSGACGPRGKETSRRVGERVIAYDLKWLLATLNWAARSSRDNGDALLNRNPLKGLEVPTNPSPQRPVLSDEHYSAMLAAADTVGRAVRCALVLAYETGHRIGSIRQLKWADVALERGTIIWRAVNDKMATEHETVLSAEAVAELRSHQMLATEAKAAWVFPSPADDTQPWGRHLARDYWERTAKIAGLPKGQRLGWHAMRRKFATDLKNTPPSDLCQLGGWKSYQTVVTCYQRPDERTMRNALVNRARPQPLSE
jgi:integrase